MCEHVCDVIAEVFHKRVPLLSWLVPVNINFQCILEIQSVFLGQGRLSI